MPHVLVIEDSPTQAEAIRLILESDGFHVEVANDGCTVLTSLRTHPFDLVLSDVLMPGISGYELCRQIKMDPQIQHVPVVLLTQLTDPMDILQGLECGADNFITKPFDANHLLHRIRTIIASRNNGSLDAGTLLSFRGTGVTITTNKEQILDLLLSTVEDYICSRRRERAAQAARELLERQKIEMAESSRQKDQHLALLAHELRNPMAPILASLHVLRQAGVSAEVREQSLQRVERQMRHLNRLVDDLVDASRLSQGKVSLRPERLDLARLVRLAVEDQQPLFQKANLTLIVNTPETPVWVEGDVTRLAQVLANLLDNAARFTDSGGRVEVELKVDPSRTQALLTFTDTGVGIESELLPQLFNPFTQADRSLDRAQGGLGLGLVVVRRLVELHQGEVGVVSAGPGEGARFTVRLPLQDEPPALSSLASKLSTPRQRARVLIIEDNIDAASSLSMLLELLGYEVQIAYSGPEGLALADSWLPKIIISDIGLPGLDGYEVARRLRQTPGTRGALLIALTGYGSEDDKLRSREAGFDHHVVKPAEPEDLQRLLVMWHS